jgi:asparagine synthase (glutamine-hydrolysing)
MCGIAGFVLARGERPDGRVVAAMCDAIRHRGPDGEGAAVLPPAALGMRRLAIIDVAGGRQPMRSDDGRFTIVFNGEVYNFEEERARLAATGVRFRTHSDTEVVLRLFEESGPASLARMRGMFAFAVWDAAEERLFLARDRIGKKPLHTWTDGRTLVFGSEIKAILTGLERLGLPRPPIRKDVLVDYLGIGYVPDPHTIFHGLDKLPPGHWLTFRHGAIEARRYWKPSFAPTGPIDEGEALERLEAELEKAVRLRLVSEVPLGAYLSGGVDSSTVVALMARVSASPVKVFCVGFEEQEFDERPFARRIAERLGVSYEEFTVRTDSAEIAEAVVRQFDEPFGDSSAIPTYYVSRMARERVTVILSGDGGDELFAGYPRYVKASGGGLVARLPRGVRRALLRPAAGVLPEGFPGRARLLDLSLDDDGRYVFAATRGASESPASIFTREFLADVGPADPGRALRARLGEAAGLDPVTRRMYADTMVYLPGDIMTKVDRMSMMVSLEARAPLLDHVVVELAASLPIALKLRGGVQKLLLRRLAHRLLSKELIERPKRGFAVPVGRWINGSWRARADDLLATLVARGILRRAFVRRLVHEHRSGRRDHGEFLWTLMALELWFRSAAGRDP